LDTNSSTWAPIYFFALAMIGEGSCITERSRGGRIFDFVCNEGSERVSPCHTYSRTSSGGVLFYSFSPDLLRDINQFDAQLRELVDSFVIEGAR
jgi:hypothetical protein